MAMKSAGEDSNFMTMKVGRGEGAVTVIAFDGVLEGLKGFLEGARGEAVAAEKAREEKDRAG